MIHKFKKNGKNFIVDSNSGAIHLSDDVVYEILDFYTPGCSISDSKFKQIFLKYGKQRSLDAFAEIEFLVRNGKLFSSSNYRDGISVLSPIKAMCLNVSHDCQLRCRYCFASHGDFGGNRCLMSFQTAKNAIDFLIMKSANRHNLEVDFFGGEPMMNFDVIKSTVEYAKNKAKIFNKNFRFTITLNGLGLDDDKINFLNEEMSNIVMSLDGRRHINDYMRVTKAGIGTYDLVIDSFRKIVKSRGKKDYYIRGTYTKRNLDFSKDVIHIYNLGFKKISLEPAVIDEDVDYALDISDLEKISQEYDILADWIYKTKKEDPELLFFHFNVDLKNGPCLTKRLKGCGCGNDYIAVTPNGDIFPCHQFVGQDSYLMGNVNNCTFFDDIKLKSIKNLKSHLDNCENCWIKNFCSPCISKTEKSSDIGCAISRSRFESFCGFLLNQHR